MRKFIALLLSAVMIVGMTGALSGCDRQGGKGRVYFLNPNPEAAETWQALASQYTEQTGVEVKVATAASGTYQEVLRSELAKEAPPTLFQCGNERELEKWGEYCLDLTDTEVLKEMTTPDFNLVDENGAVKAIGYCYEAFGIIVNKALLAQAGHDISGITDFASLKAVAEDIHSRADTLGFDAFAPMRLDADFAYTFSGTLANMPAYYRLATVPLHYEFRESNVTGQPATVQGSYLNAYKNIWDLYIQNTSSAIGGEETEPNAFAAGKAVFWHQGTWAYNELVSKPYDLDPDDLQMIPVYCGVEGEANAALCCGTESRLAVNAMGSEEDIQATLAFLKWLVTSDVSTAMMAEQFGPIPFKAAKEPENVFFADANKLITDGRYVVDWTLRHAPDAEQWKVGLASALIDYCAGNGDWTAVETAFVKGWAIQYEHQN